MIVIIKKTYRLQNTIQVDLFDQSFLIKPNSTNEIKDFANVQLKDIFENPESLTEENVELISKKIISKESNQINEEMTNASNFVVYKSFIDKSDVEVSLESVIEDKLHIILIQKLPPHFDDFQILTVQEAIQESAKISFSILIGKNID
jgi:hypothetical protein